MKTLIFNGSPRANGDTSLLISELISSLEGDHKIIRAYDSGISPCVDCRACWKKQGCIIKDGMTEVYGYIKECDNILIASPVYFSGLTGPLLSVASRLQAYYCARTFLGISMITKQKRGAVLLIGGGDGSPEPAAKTARMLLRQMNACDIFQTVSYHNTNKSPAISDPETLKRIKEIADFFNEKRS